MNSMRALIFDLDDTLIKSKINYGRMKGLIIEFLVNAGVTRGILNESMLNFEIISMAERDLTGKISRNEIMEIFKRVNEIMNRVEMESLKDAELMEDTVSALKGLKRLGLKIGIVTNGCREYVKGVMGRFSLDKYVDAVVARDDVSNPKPNPEHLHRVLNILKVHAEEAIFVGDHWVDMLCAKRAGIRFILLHGGRNNLGEIEEKPYATVSALREILPLIREIGKARNNY